MKILFSKPFFSILFLSLILASCQDEKGNQSVKKLKPQENIKVRVPAFDAKAAKEFISKQVSFGPRVPNSEGHKNCKNWMSSTLKSFGAEVIEQDFKATTFDNTILNATNIIARFNPDVQERILITAHWDTRPFAEKDPDSLRRNEAILGADDGGSGVGVILALAQILQKNPIPMGVDFVLFDAEDYGDDKNNDPESWGLGSQFWAKNPHLKREDLKYGILLDMVGAKGAIFHKEGYSAQNASVLNDKIWSLAKQMNKGKYFSDQVGGAITDDHYFVMKYFKLPMVDIINCSSENFAFGKHHHTHEDNMEVIDEAVLGAVGQVITAVIYKESNKEF